MKAQTTVLGSIVVALAFAWIFAGQAGLSGRGFGFGGGGSDCIVGSGEPEGEVLPVVAECHWDVPAEGIHALLQDWEAHQRTFSNLSESAVLAHYPDGSLVRQVHSASGIADREVVVRWRVEPVAGGMRYSWSKARDQSALSGQRIEVAVTHGYWEVTEEGAGTRVVYSVSYLPGGSVPFFLVHWFQGSGIRGVLGELENAGGQLQVAAGS